MFVSVRLYVINFCKLVWMDNDGCYGDNFVGVLVV